MKPISIFAALALSLPVAAGAQALPDTHVLVWHPSGKTPAAIPQLRGERNCVPRASHHRGSKGPAMPTNNCIASTQPASGRAVRTAQQTPAKAGGMPDAYSVSVDR